MFDFAGEGFPAGFIFLESSFRSSIVGDTDEELENVDEESGIVAPAREGDLTIFRAPESVCLAEGLELGGKLTARSGFIEAGGDFRRKDVRKDIAQLIRCGESTREVPDFFVEFNGVVTGQAAEQDTGGTGIAEPLLQNRAQEGDGRKGVHHDAEADGLAMVFDEAIHGPVVLAELRG